MLWVQHSNLFIIYYQIPRYKIIKNTFKKTYTSAPLPIQGCFIFSLVKYKPLTYNKMYQYPDWAIGVGWTLALASMICIPMVVVIKIIRSDGPLIEVGAWLLTV